MRAYLVLGVMLTACLRGSNAPEHPIPPDPVPDPDMSVATDPTKPATIAIHAETAPTALVAVAPAPASHAVIARDDKPTPKTVFVAGCNTACIDCGLGGYTTYVIGTLTRTGAKLFPQEPIAPGYACGADVAVGERVTLRAHSPTEGMVIDSWKPFFDRDSCPCEGARGSQAQTCTFTVTPEIASQYDRIYCGAAWRQKAAAQIGH
ncbi:MAG TPA: hypothetical protein VIV11_33815 [Kofleriaceae bacterium]